MFEKFQEGRHDVLVATDIASRGLDTTDVSRLYSETSLYQPSELHEEMCLYKERSPYRN